MVLERILKEPRNEQRRGKERIACREDQEDARPATTHPLIGKQQSPNCRVSSSLEPNLPRMAASIVAQWTASPTIIIMKHAEGGGCNILQASMESQEWDGEKLGLDRYLKARKRRASD